jgi:CubicO group peptidase (beta-lactamase class C family)
LLLWDKALYSNKIISKAALDLAYTPYSNEKPGTRNYGLGWRLSTFPDNTVPYHNGWWHSYNTVFYRIQQDKATIIVLSNKYNRGVYNVQPIWNILYGAFGMEGYLKADEPDE